MMSRRVRLSVLLLLSVGVANVTIAGGGDQADELARTVLDSTRSPLERNSALARLDAANPRRAVEESEKLILRGDVATRVRAAWILADAGGVKGVEVLESVASIPTDDEDVIAIEALGRLRAKSAHATLSAMLRREFVESLGRPGMPPRLSALVKALADYGDSADAPLVAPVVNRWLGPESWPYVEALGRTTGSAAVPVLFKAFSVSSRGMTMAMAGLGLSRCGSRPGRDFVLSQLSELRAGSRRPASAETRQVAEWILEAIGTAQDEGLVASLLTLAEEPDTDRTRALALAALLRVNPSTQRERVLAVAWRNTTYEAAVRLIALDDETTARQALAMKEKGLEAGPPVADVRLMRIALDSSERDKRRWREIRGYTF